MRTRSKLLFNWWTLYACCPQKQIQNIDDAADELELMDEDEFVPYPLLALHTHTHAHTNVFPSLVYF